MNEVVHCRNCGKELTAGKYCKMCMEEKKSKRKKIAVKFFAVLGAIGGAFVAVFSFVPVIIDMVGRIAASKSKD